MRPLVLAALGIGGAYLAMRAVGPRAYSKADGAALHELALRKINLGVKLRACLNQAKARKDFWGPTLGVAVGMFVGAATLNPKGALAAAQATAAAWNASHPKDAPCQAEFGQLVRDVAAHDAISKKLGMPLDATSDHVLSVLKRTGWKPPLSTYERRMIDEWNKLLSVRGLAWIEANWDDVSSSIKIAFGPGGTMQYDPKTGKAIERTV